MARSLTTRQLILSIRSLIDETNEAEIDDNLDILPSINRGLDEALDILSRKYPDALIQSKNVDLSEADDGLFGIPEDAYQERLEKVEAVQNGYYFEIPRIDYRDITSFDTTNTNFSSSGGFYYAVIGSEYKVVPAPNGISGLRIWYVPEVGPLVPEYGRIIAKDMAGNKVTVTDVEDVNQISSDINSLEAYVNVIDHRTGRIKATLQVSSIVNSVITFSTVPQASRPTVQGRTVSNSLPVDLALDDYICPVDGTCIPPMRSPLSKFLVTYASAELKALKLEGDPNVVLAQLKKFEERIEKTWVRREHSTRVSKASRNWSGPSMFRFWNRTPRS